MARLFVYGLLFIIYSATAALDAPSSLQADQLLPSVRSLIDSNGTNTNGDNNGNSIPQWETAVFAMIGCFGAISCMLGLKAFTKCYGRIRRSCAGTGDNVGDDNLVALEAGLSRRKSLTKKAKGSSKRGKSDKLDYSQVDDSGEF